MIIFFQYNAFNGEVERYAVIYSNPVRKGDAYEYDMKNSW